MRQARCLVLLLLSVSSFALAQPERAPSDQAYCSAFARTVGHGAALQDACQFILALNKRLPNFICDQKTERNYIRPKGYSRSVKPDTITAQVRYENGRETYSNIVANGQELSSMSELWGSWSIGEFGSLLRAIIGRDSAGSFKFKRQASLRGKQALIFEFQVKKSNNRGWALQAYSHAPVYPGLHGQLWLSAADHHLLRLELEAVEVDADFPLQNIKSSVDYADTHMGDGTEFVMPIASSASFCPRQSWCQNNDLEFTNCHKFGVNTRIVPVIEESDIQH